MKYFANDVMMPQLAGNVVAKQVKENIPLLKY
jgi:hypothetical protein